MSGPGDYIGGESVSIVGAADGSYKSRIPLSAGFVTVTANTNNTDDWIILPTGVKPGHTIHGWSVPAHEMRTESGSNILINNVDSDGTQEAAIPATTLWTAVYVSATAGWVLRAWTELGAPTTAIIPD